MSSLTNLQIVWHSYDSLFNTFKASPIVKRETDALRAAAPSIKSADDLVNNRDVFNYVLKAYGMEDIPYPAMIKKLLVEGTKDPKSFANSFIDVRYKEFVNDIGFGDGGKGNFDSAFFIAKLVKRHETVAFEANKGEQDSNVRLGMYFERKVSSVKNWYEVLSDKGLSEVVFTALGYPDSTRLGDIDKLAEMLEKRMNIEDFQDPEKVRTMAQRFAIFADNKNFAYNSPILQLYQGSMGNNGRTLFHIDEVLLSEVSKLRYL